ncbi:MAG: hypothetical protein DMF53_27700 [Acidobacteria bacterium]|nr:MAG: hypothetical protein DMF53_27700 [Acidobacteriota bacterium]
MSFGAGFLRHPDLFPARRAGEPWGDRALALDVAGGPYLLSGLTTAQEEALRRRFGSLCGPAEANGTATQVFRAPATDFLAIDTRGWEYTLDLDPAPDALQVAGLHLMARLGWTPALAGALWTPEPAGEEWTSVCENYLRLLTAYRLLEEGGALLHSAGVSDGEWAWLLLGPSGAGKTTASRLCLEGGGTVLSDDLNAVLFHEGTARLRKLPFTGDLGERAGGPESVPLRAVLRLAQGEEEGLRPLSPAAALASLVAAAPFVNCDPFRRETLLAVLERLARAVPAWEVTFSREGGLWAMVKTIR